MHYITDAMDTLSIDDELHRHLKVPHVNMKLHEEFSPIINEFLITTFSKKGYMLDIDIIESVVVCEKLFKAYSRALYDSAQVVKKIFEKFNILYRLYDLNFCIHTPHRIFCVWVLDGHEYAIEFSFSDQTKDNPLPFLYRVMHLGRDGVPLEGTFNPAHSTELNEETELPKWFVSALKTTQ